MNVSTQLDLIQAKLLDSAALWTRAELLEWWNDAYMGFLAESGSVRRPLIEDVPGRMAFAHSYEWETAHLDGTAYRFTGLCLGATRAGTFLWEVEQLEGVTPTTSRDGACQPWERAYVSDSDASFRFMFPREHEKTARVTWDDRLLVPVAVKQLDWLRGWNREPGQPIVWSSGTGRERSFELFEIRTDYQQGYELVDARRGGPRRLTGTRTYARSTTTPILNRWAYTTSGDRDAVSGADNHFAPTSAATGDAELVNAPGIAPYRFTYFATTDSRDYQSLGYYGTQPWEIGNRAAGASLGTYPWEGVYGVSLQNYDDVRPRIRGAGLRITTPAANPSNGFTTQAWEVQQLDGSTVSATGAKLGTFLDEASYHGATVPVFYLGGIRGASSADRQYYPVQESSEGGYTGIVRAWRSSSLSVTVDEIYSVARRLLAQESPGLVPPQVLKYLRYYVLSQCFGRQGEGFNPQLAQHYTLRYTVGMRHFQRLRDLAYRDRDWQRQPTGMLTGRPQRVRFPSTFPRVLA